MNQSELDIIKEEMARLNKYILGVKISELKRTVMGEFNSDDHFIYCGKKFLRRNEVVLIINNSPKCSTWVQSSKQQHDLCFQSNPFNITIIQVYVLTTDVETDHFYEDLQHLLELTHKKDVLFITGDWNAKVGSQEIPEITGKFGLGIC